MGTPTTARVQARSAVPPPQRGGFCVRPFLIIYPLG